jgi:hypothetical protein
MKAKDASFCRNNVKSGNSKGFRGISCSRVRLMNQNLGLRESSDSGIGETAKLLAVEEIRDIIDEHSTTGLTGTCVAGRNPLNTGGALFLR